MRYDKKIHIRSLFQPEKSTPEIKSFVESIMKPRKTSWKHVLLSKN